MAFNKQQYRVTLIHSIVGTDEIAETGFSISDDIAAFDAVNFKTNGGTSFLGDVATAWIAFLGTAGVICPSWSRFVAIKGAPLGVNGKYLAEPDVVAQFTTGTSTVKVVPQETAVISLMSRQSLGDANRGRMYLPHITGTSASGQFRIQNVSAVSAAMKTFLQAVNTASSTVTGASGSRVCIMSAKGTGTTKKVMDIRMGDLVDTQRRRRNRIAENYTTQTIIV